VSGTFRVAAVQASPVFLDRERTVAKAVTLIEEAAGAGARLIAFPETWIPAYPTWIFGAAGWEDPRSTRVFGKLSANSVEVPSAATDALCAAAASSGAVVVLGITERAGGTLYNSLLTISDEGALLGCHRKLMPTHAERIIWGQGDGSTLHVFDTSVGRVGGLACWEHWMPLTRFAMHALGEQIHIAAWPEVGDPEKHRFATRHYAFEGRCYALCVMGAALTLDKVPEDFELRDALGAAEDFVATEAGGTCVFGPDGEVLADSRAGEETIVYADIDLARVAAEQQALDVAGHYNRPDVFRLEIDARSRAPVEWLETEDPS
jgi:nitrilase